VETAAVKSAAVKSAKSSAVEPAAAPVRCLGNIWLADNGRA